MGRKKTVVLMGVVLLVVVFFYGMAAGNYKLFPYPQMEKLRTSTMFKDYFLEAKKLVVKKEISPAIVRDTFLQRLFIKEIPFDPKSVLPSARYITVRDHTLFVLDTHGELRFFDLDTYREQDSRVDRLPMNIDLLRNSPLARIDRFNILNFRTLGIHTEENRDGSHSIFVTHHRYEPDENCVSFNMSTTNLVMDDDSVIQDGEWQTLFTASPLLCPEPDEFWLSQRSGGNMAAYSDDFLLVSVGDYAFDGTRVPDHSFAMDTSVVYGKFLLVDKSTGEHHIYASGIRNSQGVTIDSHGTIWSTDHGQGGGDELNLIVEGHNYGWPESTLSIDYDEREWPYSEYQGRHNLHEKPVFGWAHAIAPTDLLRIEGDKFPLWNGDLIVATLADQSLRRLRLDSENRVIYDERIELGHRIRDLLTLPNGSIGMITDDMIFIIIEDGGAVFEPLDSLHQERFYALDGYDSLIVKN